MAIAKNILLLLESIFLNFYAGIYDIKFHIILYGKWYYFTNIYEWTKFNEIAIYERKYF